MDNYNFSGKIIRLLDSFEDSTLFLTLSASCTLNEKEITYKDIINNLKNSFTNLLNDFPFLRLKICKKNNFSYWQYALNDELAFDKLINVVEPPDDEPPKNFDVENGPMWRLHLSNFQNESKIRLFVNHSFIDGRTIFDLLDLFIIYIKNEKLNDYFLRAKKFQENKFDILSSVFGKVNWYKNNFERKKPDSWEKLIKCQMFPNVELPSYSLNTQWDYKYEDVQKFVKKYNVSVQGILTTINLRAVYNYNKNINNNIPNKIGVCIPTDTRKYKEFSTEENQNGIFYGRNGYVIIYIKNKNENILDEIIYCTKKLKKALKTPEACQNVLFSSSLIDEKSLTRKTDIKFPDCFTENLICCSHLGEVSSLRENVKFGTNNPVNEYGYWPSLYAFHTKKVLSFMLVHPYNIDKSFVKIFKSNIDEIIYFIENSI